LHTRIDIDLKNVIQVAKETFFTITEHDWIDTQLEELDQSSTFNLSNSIVDRRSLERIQMQISGCKPSTNHDRYD
jgi:hypothetical protein